MPLKEGAKIVQVHDVSDQVTQLEFTVDGAYLLTSGRDGIVRYWGIP